MSQPLKLVALGLGAALSVLAAALLIACGVVAYGGARFDPSECVPGTQILVLCWTTVLTRVLGLMGGLALVLGLALLVGGTRPPAKPPGTRADEPPLS